MQEPEQFWFLNTRVTIHAAMAANAMTVFEHHAPYGDSPPLHVHAEEDEVFHVIAGEVQLRLDGRDLFLRAGETFCALRNVPHTYRVISREGARFLTFTSGGDFERLVRALGRPATHDGLPVPAGAPTTEQEHALAETCLRHGIMLLGPPLAAVAAAA